MLDYISLSPVPTDEKCAQLGEVNYMKRARKECNIFKRQLIRTLGTPPPGVFIKIKRNNHDFGVYLDLVVEFDENDKEGIDYAFRLENELPERWDEEAKKELSENFEIPITN